MSRLKFVSVAEETNLGLVEQLRRQVFSWRDSFHIQHSNRLTIRKGWSLAVSLCVRYKFTETLLCWSDNLRQQVKTFEPRHDKTIQMSVRPPKTQISLGIRPVWSESSLCALWVANDPSFLLADSEDCDQIWRMPRLIWVFAGRTLILLGLSCRGSYYIILFLIVENINIIFFR